MHAEIHADVFEYKLKRVSMCVEWKSFYIYNSSLRSPFAQYLACIHHFSTHA